MEESTQAESSRSFRNRNNTFRKINTREPRKNFPNRSNIWFVCWKREHFARECRELMKAASRQDSDRSQPAARGQSVGVRSKGSMRQAFGKCSTVKALIRSAPVQALLQVLDMDLRSAQYLSCFADFKRGKLVVIVKFNVRRWKD